MIKHTLRESTRINGKFKNNLKDGLDSQVTKWVSQKIFKITVKLDLFETSDISGYLS